MTLIGATQINKKWTLFTDDCLTVGEAKISSSLRYRSKLREVNGKNCHLIIASCGSTKDIDFTINMIEAEVNRHKAKDTLGLQFQLQTVLLTSMKALKEVRDDPQFTFLILETTTNTLWASEEYSLFLVQDYVDIVFGSAEQSFHQLSKDGFFTAFMRAVEANEYCAYPIYGYRDGKMFVLSGKESEEERLNFLHTIGKENVGEKKGAKVYSKTTKTNKGGNSGEVCGVLSGSGLSCQETAKLG